MFQKLSHHVIHFKKEWEIYRVNATISGEKRKVAEQTWVIIGGGIEIPCKYFLYGPVIHKTFLRNELRK